MKLATYKDGSRDGQLVVVSRDLSTAHYATGIATRLQQVLDDWNFLAPQLQDLYATLNSGKARHAFPFDPKMCMAPLPRAYQWADGSAYINHVELVRAARNSEVPASFYEDPLMYQGGSDDFIGPCDPVVVPSEDYGIDFEAEIAVITGDVPMCATPEQATTNVYRIGRDGQITAVITDLVNPNGLAFSPDEKKLYVVEWKGTPHRSVWSFDVAADGHTLSNKTKLIDAAGPGALDGFRVDRDGNLWCGWGFSGAFAPEASDIGGGMQATCPWANPKRWTVSRCSTRRASPSASSACPNAAPT